MKVTVPDKLLEDETSISAAITSQTHDILHSRMRNTHRARSHTMNKISKNIRSNQLIFIPWYFCLNYFQKPRKLRLISKTGLLEGAWMMKSVANDLFSTGCHGISKICKKPVRAQMEPVKLSKKLWNGQDDLESIPLHKVPKCTSSQNPPSMKLNCNPRNIYKSSIK